MSLSNAGKNIMGGVPMTEGEMRDQRKLEGLRQRAEARIRLVSNPWERTCGKDTAALEAQTREKEARRAAEKAEAEAEFQRQRQIDRYLQAQAGEQQRQASEKKAQLQAEWANQARESARRKERQAAEDGKAGSSMRFDGEDEFAAERRRMQQLQMQSWIQQQQADKARANEKDARLAKRELARFQRNMDAIANLGDSEADRRKRLAKETQRANLMASKMKLSKAKQLKNREQRRNEAAFDRSLNDPVLTESAAPGETSALGGHRVRTDHWKGMNAKQKQEIAAENARLVEGKNQRRECEAQEQRAYQQQLQSQARALELHELRQEDARRTAQAQQANAMRAHEMTMKKKAAKEAAERQKEGFSSGFFGSFGRGGR